MLTSYIPVKAAWTYRRWIHRKETNATASSVVPCPGYVFPLKRNSLARTQRTHNKFSVGIAAGANGIRECALNAIYGVYPLPSDFRGSAVFTRLFYLGANNVGRTWTRCVMCKERRQQRTKFLSVKSSPIPFDSANFAVPSAIGRYQV